MPRAQIFERPETALAPEGGFCLRCTGAPCAAPSAWQAPGTQRVHERLRDRVRSCAQLVEAYSYHKVLNRGFALVRDTAGAPIRAAAGVASGDHIEIEFSDGRIGAIADSGEPARRKPKTPGKDGKKSEQGGLFD